MQRGFKWNVIFYLLLWQTIRKKYLIYCKWGALYSQENLICESFAQFQFYNHKRIERLETAVSHSTFEFSITIKPSLLLSFSKNSVSEQTFFERERCCWSSFFFLWWKSKTFVHFLVNNNFSTSDVKKVSVKHFVVTFLVVVRIKFEQNL